jgi:DNA-binding protein HU-beta
MRKMDLVVQVSQRTGVPKETVLKSLNGALAVIAEALARGEDVRLKGFGTFGVRPRRSTRRSHVLTQQIFSIPSKATPRFYPGASAGPCGGAAHGGPAAQRSPHHLPQKSSRVSVRIARLLLCRSRMDQQELGCA